MVKLRNEEDRPINRKATQGALDIGSLGQRKAELVDDLVITKAFRIVHHNPISGIKVERM